MFTSRRSSPAAPPRPASAFAPNDLSDLRFATHFGASRPPRAPRRRPRSIGRSSEFYVSAPASPPTTAEPRDERPRIRRTTDSTPARERAELLKFDPGMEAFAEKSVAAFASETDPEPDSSVDYPEGAVYKMTNSNVKIRPESVSFDFSSPDSVRIECVKFSEEETPVAGGKFVSKREFESKTRVGFSRANSDVATEPVETIPSASEISGVATIRDVVRSVSSGNRTLWPPTPTADEGELEDEADAPPSAVSQIFLTGGGQRFTPHAFNSSSTTGPKSCHVANSKFQILGSITIPKSGALPNVSQANVSGNVKMQANYPNQNDGSAVNASTISSPDKSVGNLTSVLNHIGKMNSVNLSRGQHGQAQIKSIVNSASIQLKGMPPSVNRPINKMGNVANNKLENCGAATAPSGHALSRVLPNPKISVQPAGRVVKSGSIQYGQKSTGNVEISQSSVMHGHKVQPAMPVKIIQQQSFTPNHKSAMKPVQTSRAGVNIQKNISYGTLNSVSGKNWTPTSSSSINALINPKYTSPYSKNITGVVNVQKLHSKNPQKMIVHQPSNPIIMSNSQHFQSPNEAGNGFRFVQNYNNMDNNQLSTSNQDLTAQILQSLSQPKHLFPSPQHISANNSKRLPVPCRQTVEDIYVSKKNDQRRHIHGDPNTLMTSDDIPGVEDRPNLSADSLPYHYQSLQLVMLDHTYALSTQSISNNPVNGSNVITSNTSPVNNNNTLPSPMSPGKIVTLASNSPNSTGSGKPVPIVPTIIPSNSFIQNTPTVQYNLTPNEDDDAASIISSIEGDKDTERADDRQDSDTETAPEGEEEGKTRCVCEFTHDDGYMICCDRCGEWQHVDCMGIDRQNIPDDYMCDRCEPRSIDRKRARSIQIRKREEITGLGSSGSDSSSGLSLNNHRNKPNSIGPSGTNKKRPLTVTTYSNTISGVSRTVPPLPSISPPYAATGGSQLQNKKNLKRPRRIDNGRKGPKRKFPEKRKRKASEISNYRSKYCSFTSSHQLNQWNDSYEVAMTNHYSPELRAKIARYCNNKGANNVTNMMDVLTVHLCTTVPHAGSKILIATKDMKENTPIIELRGKYMLSTQHKPQPQVTGRVGSQKPGPFLFFYRLPKDSTQICIDTRTYGNEARFVRRSCKPNAELQHCIIKGALHVYLVTISTIQSNTEISIRHDATDSSHPCACGNPKHCKQTTPSTPAASKINSNIVESVSDRRGRTRLSSSSSVNNLSPSAHVKNEDFIKMETMEFEKNSEVESDLVAIKQEVENSILKNEDVEMDTKDVKPHLSEFESKLDEKCKPSNSEQVKEENSSDVKEEIPEAKKIKTEDNESSISTLNIKQEDVNANTSDSKNCASKNTISPTSKSKEEKSKKIAGTRRTSLQSTRTTRASTHSVNTASESADEKSDNQSDSKSQPSKEKKKMTREERKMEAIMKAFERLEKAELRKQENKDRQSKRRESDSHQTSISDSKENLNDDPSDEFNDSSNSRRKRKKKCRPRTVSQNQQRNRNRLNSADSEMLTSGEESLSLLSPPISSNNVGMNTLMDSTASSEDVSAFNEPLSDSLQLRQSVQRLNVGLSSACLLVEAAVGPLESTFKFPKTKKDIMNEWLNKSPERNTSFDINNSLDYNTSDNNNSTYAQEKMFIGEKFQNLMKAASTMIGNFSGSTASNQVYNSPQKIDNATTKKDEFEVNKDAAYFSNEKKIPRRYRKGMKSEEHTNVKRCLRSNADNLLDVPTPFGDFTPPHENSFISTTSNEIRDAEIAVVSHPLQHSAKKRWLRQAISEESDSPTAESPPNEMLTPLKKRRLARESLSMESSNNCDESQHCGNLQTSKKLTTENTFQSPKSITLNISPRVVKDFNTSDSEILIHAEVKTPIENEKEVKSKEDSEKCQQISNAPMETDESNIEDSFDTDNNKVDAKEEAIDNISSVNLENENEAKNAADDSQKDAKTDLDSSETDEKVDDLSWKNHLSLEEIIGVDKLETNVSVECLKYEPSGSNVHSAETSGNSSPLLDDMDDIQKKIHTFHTENIQILQIRNKKQPKEKRKKVNLNFDLCVLADETIGVKLKSENDIVPNATETVENKLNLNSRSDLLISENVTQIELTEKDSTELPEHTITSPNKNEISSSSLTATLPQKTEILNKEDENDSRLFTPFTNSFNEDTSSSNIQMPDINVIKNAIDMTASLEIGLKSSNILNSNDEYKNVQEILSRVNQMDSHNSLLLSGVLKDSSHSLGAEVQSTTPNKIFSSKSNDPRLNPPPAEKPKPIRRKLSITEYRRRHSMVSGSGSESSADNSSGTNLNMTAENESAQTDAFKKNENILDCFNSIVTDTNELSNLESESPTQKGTLSPQCEGLNSIESDSHIISHNLNSTLGNKSPYIKTTR